MERCIITVAANMMVFRFTTMTMTVIGFSTKRAVVLLVLYLVGITNLVIITHNVREKERDT